ncbi:hypothetical protein [Kitasatospora sp. P5_F3]
MPKSLVLLFAGAVLALSAMLVTSFSVSAASGGNGVENVVVSPSPTVTPGPPECC